MTGLTSSFAFSVFIPQGGVTLWLFIAATMLLGVAFLFLLTQLPSRFRRPLVIGITFLAGWFYFLEFMIPGDRALAPARRDIRAAENQLRIVEHAVTPQFRDPKGIIRLDRNSGAARFAEARRALDSADARLSKTLAYINDQIPKAQAAFDKAVREAEAFARQHRLTDELLEKGEGYIQDLKTQTLKKRVDDLAGPNGAKGKIEQVLETIRDARQKLASPSPSGLRDIKGSTTGAIEAATLARIALSDNFLTPYTQPLANVLLVIGAFTVGLGIYSLSSIHGKAVIKRRAGWHNSLAFFIAMVAMAVFAFLQKYAGGNVKSFSDAIYTQMLFNGIYTALNATMFSLAAFYMVSAAYRAFRIKSGEAAIMMAAAFLVMLGIVPIGQWLTGGISYRLPFLHLEIIQNWIMNVPNMAAQRGMAFGIGVGGLAMALRIWLSLERGSFFDKQM